MKVVCFSKHQIILGVSYSFESIGLMWLSEARHFPSGSYEGVHLLTDCREMHLLTICTTYLTIRTAYYTNILHLMQSIVGYYCTRSFKLEFAGYRIELVPLH